MSDYWEEDKMHYLHSCLFIWYLGTPPFDVVWVKDGCVLPDCDDFQQHVFGDGKISLCLTDAFAEDGGEYFCEVFNPFGEDTTKCRLSVKGS